jgi:hypothetical protein
VRKLTTKLDVLTVRAEEEGGAVISTISSPGSKTETAKIGGKKGASVRFVAEGGRGCRGGSIDGGGVARGSL